MENEHTNGRPSRFVWGVTLGVGIGAITVVIVIALAATIVYSTAMTRFPGLANSRVEVVRSSDPWIKMVDKSHGQISGFAGGGSSSGSGMPYGAIAEFNLRKPTQQDGVRAEISVSIYVTQRTKMTMGGKPWKPKSQSGKPPSTAVFLGAEDEANDAFLEMRELTVDFRFEGHDLVAERIDASKKRKELPSWIH